MGHLNTLRIEARAEGIAPPWKGISQLRQYLYFCATKASKLSPCDPLGKATSRTQAACPTAGGQQQQQQQQNAEGSLEETRSALLHSLLV